MRLPLIAPLESRDGTSNKDSRFTNMLAETNDAGVMVAVKRPGLVSVASPTGTAQGLCEFDGELISIYNATLGRSVATVTEALSPTLAGATPLYPSSGNARKGASFLSVGGYTGGVYDDKVRYSSDGATWASYSDGGWGNGSYGPLVCADDTYYYAIIHTLSDAKVYRSTSGSSWTLMKTITTSNFPWFHCWPDGLYYYDGSSVYRSVDGASTFSMIGINTGSYAFSGAPICGTTIDGTHYIYDGNFVIASSSDKIVWNNTGIFPAALDAYDIPCAVFNGGYLFVAQTVDSTHTYIHKIGIPGGDYTSSAVIADQPVSFATGYMDSYIMFEDSSNVFLPGDTGVWQIPVAASETTTISTIASLAGDEVFDFAKSPL